MSLKFCKPVTPSMRSTALVNRAVLDKKSPFKHLVRGRKSLSARNHCGHMTVRNRGGAHKRLLRDVDLKRGVCGKAEIVSVEYDPGRTAWICGVRYEDSTLGYILASEGMAVGGFVESGEKLDVAVGNCMPLSDIPTGVAVHNVELTPGKGGQLARAAGTCAYVVGKDGKYVLLRLRSGEIRYVLAMCKATVGVVSNPDNKNRSIGKAGRSRWLGRKPRVRGVAMNPVDHPLGGGEGKTSGGRHPVSRHGKPAKGKKTRSLKRYSNGMIKVRRNAKSFG